MGVERLDLRIAQLITGEFLGTLVSLVDIYSYNIYSVALII